MAQAVLFMCMNTAGTFISYLSDRAQRQAFLETRRCVEARLRLETENQRQVPTGRAWRSVSPASLRSMELSFFFPPQTNLDFECSLKVCVQDSRVQSSYVRLLAQSTSGFVSHLQLNAVYEK